MVAYVRWQRRHAVQLGLDDPDKMGGFAWLLPEKDRSSKPSPLPEYVLKNQVSDDVIQMYQRQLVSMDAGLEEPNKKKESNRAKEPKMDWDTGYSLRAELSWHVRGSAILKSFIVTLCFILNKFSMVAYIGWH